MLDVQQSDEFKAWFAKLKDRQARAIIFKRIDRLMLGNAGDAKPVGEGVSELRINHGPGYRIYFCRIGATVLLLLIGGDKGSQTKDIARAKALASSAKDQP